MSNIEQQPETEPVPPSAAAPGQSPSVWDDVLKDEMKALRPGGDPGEAQADLVGLALSGGGIRSATFNLGVLEALKKLGLLDKIDYLSTVSGGGYIGAWLSANCYRHKDWRNADKASWDQSIQHLRNFSNYLAPKVGFFSADTWSMATIWLRNTLLVQAMTVLALAIVLALPRLAYVLFENWPFEFAKWYPALSVLRWFTIVSFLIGVTGVAGNQLVLTRAKREGADANGWFLGAKHWAPCALAGIACWLIPIAAFLSRWGGFKPFESVRERPMDELLVSIAVAVFAVAGSFLLLPAAIKLASAHEAMTRFGYDQEQVQVWVVLPMGTAAFLVASVLWAESQPSSAPVHMLARLVTYGELFTEAWRYWPFPLTVVFVSLVLLAACSVRWKQQKAKAAGLTLLAAAVSAAIFHAILCGLVLLFESLERMGDVGAWHAFIWGAPSVMFGFSLAIVALIGMLGRQSTEGSREWWSRLGAWLAIYATAWIAISAASIYAPHTVWKWHWGLNLSWTWVAATLSGLFAGGSDNTSGSDQEKSKKGLASKALEIVAQVAPFLFIAGLFVAVATGMDATVANVSEVGSEVVYWTRLQMHTTQWTTLYVLIGAILGLLLLALRVDINEFSLNAFYRSRLVRCYLGATRGERTPQSFTNFDDADDLALSNLVQKNNDGTPGPLTGPFHLVNCALNLGGSSELNVHTRHSANFVLTPLYCGSSYRSRAHPSEEPTEIGYVNTADYAGNEGQPTLGQAISVSGAAASPNSGYHTSPAMAFLLTLFNARLGWWFPNPASTETRLPSPEYSLPYLVRELFGLAHERAPFLAISDGGHFENLGIYELVRRKCRVIIAGDAECDADLKFESLGMVIRMCEVDLRAKIKIDVTSLGKGANGWSGNRCAVGTIEYGDGIPDGTLIYLKASMNGNEATSIRQYKSAHPTFPHESTGNQFYGEDQFDSYRLLGYEIATAAFEPAVAKPKAPPPVAGPLLTGMVAKAKLLENVWASTRRDAAEFVQNTSRLMDIWQTLGARPELSFLDQQVFEKYPGDLAKDQRPGFYLGNQILQLMENVYLDLKLDETWEHPDVQGWANQFRIWAKAPFVVQAWERSNEIYGTRFAYFCHRRLEMPLPGTEKAAAAASGTAS